MLSKKTLKSIHDFNEHQRPGPSFLVIYVLTWLAWHNQLITSFVTAKGSVDEKFSIALTSVTENQYLLVFFFACIIFCLRLVVNFLRFKSNELLSTADEDLAMGSDQNFAKNSDMAKLMALYETNKQKLIDANEREKQAIAEKNTALKKLMTVQHELEEVKAEVIFLTNTVDGLKK